jgi:aspartyl-tRNA(Asn)/glutamyl-tRNA(Gln) amidotransferase subunit B
MTDLGLPEYDAAVLLEDLSVADYFEAVAREVEDSKQASNWVMGEVLRIMKEENVEIDQLRIGPPQLAKIIQMVQEGRISHTAAKTVFDEVARSGMDPQSLVEELGLEQVSDSAEIEKIVVQVMNKYPAEVHKFLEGKEGIFRFLVGQVMKATKGKANPRVVNNLLRKTLEKM